MTRVVGIIIILCSILAIWRTWSRREVLFHRLVLGMGIHLVIFGVTYVVGAAAVPAHTTNAIGNTGTMATCTAQGFLIYVASLSAIFYYISFSLNCTKGTSRRFQKYVHLGVHVYPVCSGIYLASLFSAFNNTGFGRCFLENDPIGCDGSGNDTEEEGYVPCVRGTASHRNAWLVELLWILPLYVAMIVPTAIIINLYLSIRMNQFRSAIPASSVAKQGMLYLGLLYAGIFPWALVRTLEWSDQLNTEMAFRLNVFAEIMFGLFGLLCMMFYFYVTDPRWVVGGNEDEDDDEENSVDNHGRMADFIFEPSAEQARDDHDNTESSMEIGDATKPMTESSVTHDTRHTSASSRSSTKDLKIRASRRKSKRKSRKYSFNIFDGSNASGLFADFIFDADSEDMRNDRKETEKWNACQNHI